MMAFHQGGKMSSKGLWSHIEKGFSSWAVSGSSEGNSGIAGPVSPMSGWLVSPFCLSRSCKTLCLA